MTDDATRGLWPGLALVAPQEGTYRPTRSLRAVVDGPACGLDLGLAL
jgi:hypothetical protein